MQMVALRRTGGTRVMLAIFCRMAVTLVLRLVFWMGVYVLWSRA